MKLPISFCDAIFKENIWIYGVEFLQMINFEVYHFFARLSKNPIPLQNVEKIEIEKVCNILWQYQISK